MNQKRFLLILLIIVGALALSACVPTTTGGDASSAIVPTATSEVVSTIAAPPAASGQEAAVVEESTAEQPVEGDNQTEVSLASEIIGLDETWNQYTNYRLGFTIRFPKEMAAMVGSCYWNEERGSYRLEMAFVPVGIFEDADAVYIAPQHYFELAGERVDGGKHYYDECNPITNSLELLREEREMSMVQFWKLVAQDVRDEGELESFIKARYFPGCSLGEQSASNQDGVYDVQIQGDGLGLDGTCPMNYAYKLKYFPSGDRVIAWNMGQAYTFLSAVDWSDGYDGEMVESFQFLTGPSVETAEEPLATVGYSNDETGIAFNYPTSWAMEEEANAFIFRQGSIVLRVGYRMPGQTADLHGRTGMGGTGVGALEGTAQFLEQALPKYGVYYDDVLKTVVYGGEPGAIVQSGAMEFTIVIDILDADYHTLTITDEVAAEAEMILASFAVGSSQGGPSAGLNTYISDEYGFALNYPSTWTVAEVNDEEFVGPGSRSVQFSQGTVTLVIGYRRAGEEVALSGSGAPGGEFEVRGMTRLLGRDVERWVIVYGGKDKVVMYGQPGSGPHALGGLEFSARLNEFNPDYDSVELPQIIQDEADMIVSSLAIIETAGPSDSDFSGWQTYTNDVVGYSLMIPADAQIMAQDPSWRVGFIGPEVDGKPRFQIMIEHYVPNYPEGTDFRESLLEGFRAYLDSLGIDHEGRIEELTIAGESAILTRHPGTSAADQPRADYFFMHGDMTFTISITLFGGAEDSALNDQFLSSITFAP